MDIASYLTAFQQMPPSTPPPLPPTDAPSVYPQLTGWHETLELYVTLPALCEPAPGGRRLRLPGGGGGGELDALHGSLRDLATHLYLLGRLAALFNESAPDAGPLVHE